MSGETQITIVGNLAGDPELRFINSGAAVVNFTVASTPRRFDKSKNEWVDGETLWSRCSLFGTAAENVAETLTKGVRVVVTGNLVMRSYDKDGEKRYVTEVQATEVALSLKSTRVRPENIIKSVAKQDGGGGFDKPEYPAGGSSGDPWGTGSAVRDDEPPFFLPRS